MDIVKLIEKKAKEKKRKILLIEGEDDRVIEAASMAARDNICKPTLLGKRTVIERIADKKKIKLSGVDIWEFADFPESDKFAEQLYELRKHKGMTLGEAKKLLKNSNYFGALLLKLGKFDGAVGGCVFNTAEWMRPVFQIIGKKEGVSIVSAICIVPIKDKVFFFSDTDFNIRPNEEELAQIAINASDFVNSLGIKPKVALLSYSSKGSGEHESLGLIRNALKIAKDKRKELVIDGELQLDASINPESAKKKSPDSVLKGEANVLIFPDITVGNVLIHALNQWTDYQFFGSFPIGLQKSVMNGGRSFSAQRIYDVIKGCAMECNL